jgi:hypothetical protein
MHDDIHKMTDEMHQFLKKNDFGTFASPGHSSKRNDTPPITDSV